MSDLHYDYTASKLYAESVGLKWLGDEFLKDADADAYSLGFTQIQADCALRHHLWQVRYLFNPASYRWYQRAALAFHFLFGGMMHV